MKNRSEMGDKFRLERKQAKPPKVYFQNLGYTVIRPNLELVETNVPPHRVTQTGNILKLVEAAEDRKKVS